MRSARGGTSWRFASLIPSGCRLTPIHKVMGDHASRGSTSAGVLPPHGLSRCFFRDMCLPPPDLGPPPDAVAGRGHTAGLQETDLQGVIKHGVETWPKNDCISTLLQNWYLIISELRIRPWPHPDWFSCCQAQLFHRNKQ